MRPIIYTHQWRHRTMETNTQPPGIDTKQLNEYNDTTTAAEK